MNPDPVLRVEADGTVLYANKAAYVLLDYWGIKEGEKVPKLLSSSLNEAFSQENPKNVEVRIGDKKYAVQLHPFLKDYYINIQGFDISSGIPAEEKLHKREKQYLSLSNLSRISIACKDFQEILRESARLVAEGIGTEFSTILELLPDGNLIMRAGFGWEEGIAGNTIVRGKEESHSGYTLLEGKPIFLRDIETETRFRCSEFIRGHGVISGITIPIGKINKPFGVLGVYSTTKREFTEDDIYFLDSASFLLSEIIERFQAEEQLRVHQYELERLIEKRTLEYAEANEKLAQEVLERRKVEKTLMNTVSFLETLLNSVPSPVFQRDLNDIYINCNESFARQIMGLPKEEVIRGSFLEFQKRIPKELAEIYERDDKKLIENRGSQYYETKVVCADGVQRDFLFHKATYADNSGEVAGVVGVILDITERKKAEKTFKKSEERYRIAAEQTGQLVYDYDVESGKIDWAGAIKELTGYNLEEFQKLNRRGWELRIHFEDRKRVTEELEEYKEKGERFAVEYRFRRKDGSFFYVEDRGIFLKDDQDLYSSRAIGVMKDITEIKMASEKLKESEERYRSFMKNFRGIAFQEGLDSIPILVDGSVEEVTGYKTEDFISGKVDWDKLVLLEERNKYLENREKLLNDPLLFLEHEYSIRHRNGRVKWVRETIQNALDASGKKRILQGLIYDITKQKEAEESLRKIEEIRKKEIHHRIKNNLQVISSLLELQAERFSEKEVLEAFHESQNRVIAMSIIHEELYQSKNNETLDFSAYLQKLTSLLRSYNLRKNNVQIQLDLEEIYLGMDTAVPLGIIINELVTNSLKHAFSPDTEGEICIKLRRTQKNRENKDINNRTNIIDSKCSVDESNHYKLTVSDNGLGFPENVDFRNTRSLGLQLVNALVEQLEGTIELEKGKGTIFKIFFKENN
jgi:PAS domain S-box-containing protein